MTFFEEFKAMFDNPFERGKLIEFFEQCVKELTENPKPIRVAVVGYGNDFYGFIKNIAKQFTQLSCERISSNSFKIAHFEFVWCVNERQAQGNDFQAYTMVSRATDLHYNLGFYLIARNIPHLREPELFKELSATLLNQAKNEQQ